MAKSPILRRADISNTSNKPARTVGTQRNARMRPGYHRKRSNPVEKVMRPGILSLALMIGFGITYMVSPGHPLSPAEAGQMAPSEETGQNSLIVQGADTNNTYEGDADARHRECIYVPGIDGFKVIDNKHLTVSTSPKRIYLITLWNRCHRLKWAHQIAIKSTGSWTCSGTCCSCCCYA